jgi:copper chaperone NosL
MDYVNRQWLEAEQAVFVRSEAIRSPMAGGLAAFRDQPAAQQFLKNSSGQMISFAELIGHEPPARQAAD